MATHYLYTPAMAKAMHDALRAKLEATGVLVPDGPYRCLAGGGYVRLQCRRTKLAPSKKRLQKVFDEVNRRLTLNGDGKAWVPGTTLQGALQLLIEDSMNDILNTVGAAKIAVNKRAPRGLHDAGPFPPEQDAELQAWLELGEAEKAAKREAHTEDEEGGPEDNPPAAEAAAAAPAPKATREQVVQLASQTVVAELADAHVHGWQDVAAHATAERLGRIWILVLDRAYPDSV